MSHISDVAYAKNTRFKELFESEKQLRDEINARAWSFLKAIGYDWYKVDSITVIMFKRLNVDIVEITASVEKNHQPVEIKTEVPLTIFEMTLKTDFAS